MTFQPDAEGSGAREELTSALHLIRSQRLFRAPAEVNAAVDDYVRQDPDSFGSTLNVHDADPTGIAVPVAVAVRESDPSRQTRVYPPPKDVRINRDGRTAQQIADAAAHGNRIVGDLNALIRQAELEAGMGTGRGRRRIRRPWWLT